MWDVAIKFVPYLRLVGMSWVILGYLGYGTCTSVLKPGTSCKGAPIVRSAYRISAYRCAIARIGIGQIIADTADYRVAHAQTIYSTD